MKPVHFQGLNCFHACVITIAADFGVDFASAFGRLWSERDFRFDPHREEYLSKRLITELEALGAEVTCSDCFSAGETAEKFAALDEGEFVIIGMDAYYIPWNQSYGVFHGPHYLIARNDDSGNLPVIDPIFNKSREEIPRRDILSHTFDIGRVKRAPVKSFSVDIKEEAREILNNHEALRGDILRKIRECAALSAEDIILLAKYTDSLICNRYLYRYFLMSRPEPPEHGHLFLREDYFARWAAVKNGLYKAAVMKERGRIVSELCECFNGLIEDEMTLAADLLSIK